MTKCPACLVPFGPAEYAALAHHLVARADDSDSDHVRWLNQNLTRHKTEPGTLAPLLERVFALDGRPLSAWVRSRFIAKFFGEVPHPFVVALQRPSRATLLGYVFEHQHFLRQWVRSCAYIIARTDQPEVVLYELDNLNTEFGGFGPTRVSHYELLLRMGESLGVDREVVLATPPLATTQRTLEAWNELAAREHWVGAVAAMHSLELIASRTLVDEGARLHYFDPALLGEEDVPAAVKNFLREGYEADVGHSDEALALVDRHAVGPGLVEDVQAVFLRSADLFDDYLVARLQRAGDFEA